MDNEFLRVKDIGATDRQAIEHILGGPLSDDQQVAIFVKPGDSKPQAQKAQAASENPSAEFSLPEWCHVYAGLSPEAIADLEASILSRANLSRSVG
jgi:hypothetical protein